MGGGQSEWNPFIDPGECSKGQLMFLVVVYGVTLFQASNLISDGSELLLLVPPLAPIVGSVVLPVLGAVPDGMMVLFSGLGDDAQEQVSVGVGALAGSTIMLLTLPWFMAMVSGRVNIVKGSPTYKRPPGDSDSWDKLQPPGNLSPFGTGVGLRSELTDAARLMLITAAGYLLIQVPAFCVDDMGKSRGGISEQGLRSAQAREARSENLWALVGFVVCIVGFVHYLWKMWADSRGEGALGDKIAGANVDAIFEGKLTLRGALSEFRESKWGSLNDKKGLEEALLNKDVLAEVRRMCKVLAPFFAHYDQNGDSQIDFEEFRMIFKDVRENLTKEAQREMFNSADADGSGNISFEEFVACLMSFALDPTNDLKETGRRRTVPDPSKYLENMSVDGGADEDDEESGAEEEDIPLDLTDLPPEEQQRRIKGRAFFKMAIGSALVLAFSDPTVDVLSEIGHRLDISPFYVSFVLAPFASNATEVVAAYSLAKKRTAKSMSAALGTLLGAGVMNNTFCLGIFLGLVYFKNLAWEFTAETLAIVTVEALIGVAVLRCQTMETAYAYCILSLYPLSLLLVWFLENVAGFD